MFVPLKYRVRARKSQGFRTIHALATVVLCIVGYSSFSAKGFVPVVHTTKLRNQRIFRAPLQASKEVRIAGKLEERLKKLQEDAFKECLQATEEDDAAIERCRSQSYELATLEQMAGFSDSSY